MNLNSRFDLDFLEDSTELLRAIAHPIRLSIVDLLRRKEKLNVTDIHESLEIDQAIASHHLRILKDKNVLQSQRAGKKTFYMLKHTEVGDIIDYLQRLKRMD